MVLHHAVNTRGTNTANAPCRVTPVIVAVRTAQHVTQPPARYTEAGLVRRLEELGIGRPSTYAAIVGVLQARRYVALLGGRFVAIERGRVVMARSARLASATPEGWLWQQTRAPALCPSALRTTLRGGCGCAREVLPRDSNPPRCASGPVSGKGSRTCVDASTATRNRAIRSIRSDQRDCRPRAANWMVPSGLAPVSPRFFGGSHRKADTLPPMRHTPRAFPVNVVFGWILALTDG